MASNHCACFFLSSLLTVVSAQLKATHTNDWAVKIDADPQTADHIASRNGFTNMGKIAGLDNVYDFQRRGLLRRMPRSAHYHTMRLLTDPQVKWAEQQVIKKRVRRQKAFVMPRDDYWHQQWYLNNRVRIHGTLSSHNIVPVWKQGVNGTGVVVSILDDGLQRNHPDIRDNYDARASYDFNSRDSDPYPRRTRNNENNHGTRGAGLVAAVKNRFCIVGVAFKARIGGVRMLDGDVTDSIEAKSLAFNRDHIDIYSCSWGPDDDGKTVDGPGRLAKASLADGAQYGRNGLGSIYVWASGNGGEKDDSCGCDGYANSIYTISVGSVTAYQQQPWYLESCASTLVSTYSSGSTKTRNMATTDIDSRCTLHHTGTSASTSLMAGIIALAMQANSRLTWRDVQHLLVRSSKKVDPHGGEWVTNNVGRDVSHRYGYGIVDAERLVNLSRGWKTVPTKSTCALSSDDSNRKLRLQHETSKLPTKACKGTLNEIRYLEHVELRITLKAKRRGKISILLRSAKGTKSTLLHFRRHDSSRRGYEDWTFMTTHCWGENPRGTWKLVIKSETHKPDATLGSWTLILHGTKSPVKEP